MKALTVTLNAAIDITYALPYLQPGESLRVHEKIYSPGGKGNNVAKILNILGDDVIATGFVGGYTGQFIEESLQSIGIVPKFVKTRDASRLCIAVIEEANGRVSELLEPGANITRDESDKLLELVKQLATEVDTVVFSGSLPKGVPNDYYRILLSQLKGLNVQTVLDTSGESLRLGIRGKPNIIKPNRKEIQDLMGRDSTVEEIIAFCRQELLAKRLSTDAIVLLTLGKDGAILLTKELVLQATPPDIKVVNPVGAGDALLAGFLHAQSVGKDPDLMLKYAVAVGTASALQKTAGNVNPQDIDLIMSQVTVRTLLLGAE